MVCAPMASAPILPTHRDPAKTPVDKPLARWPPCENVRMSPRFLTLDDVQEALNISSQQAYALVRSGDLPAIQVGGRGVWRVEATELENYIERQYEASRRRAAQARGAQS